MSTILIKIVIHDRIEQVFFLDIIFALSNMKQLFLDLITLDCYSFTASFGHNPYTDDIEAEISFFDEYGDRLDPEIILQNDRIRSAFTEIQSRGSAGRKI